VSRLSPHRKNSALNPGAFHTLKKFHKPCEMWKDNLWKTGSPQGEKLGLWKSKKIYTEPVEKKSLMGQAETGFST